MLEHAFKLYEKVLAERLCGLIDIYKMQYGFMSGRGTVDTVLVLKRLREKSRAKNKLFFIFFDLKKAFDWLRREVIHFALRQKGVPEYLVGLCLFIKVVKLLSQLMKNYQVHSL